MNNINNIQQPPDGNNYKTQFIQTIKAFFANSWRKIANFLKIKNKVQTEQDITIAQQAKDIIPEHANVTAKINPKEITDLTHINPETGKKENYTLGEGSFGKVQIVAPNDKNKKISPVLIKKQFLDAEQAGIKASTESKIEHDKNVVIGNDSILDESNNAIISKYKGESLRKLLESEITPDKQFSNEVKASICYQLLEQLTELHKKGVLHQDLKPENILIDAKGKLSIIDLAGALQNSSKSQDYSAKYSGSLFTYYYAPPEIHLGNKIERTQYFDCWSAGVIMYELYTGKKMLANCFVTDISGNTKFDKMKLPDALRAANNELYTNKKIPPKMRNLILQLLTIEPTKRPTAEQALNSPAFNDKKNIQEMTQIDLNTQHDKHFKQLVNLEVELEVAQNNQDSNAVTNIQSAIDKEKLKLTQLQSEINRRKNL